MATGSSEEVRKRVVVAGRVQGVFFRDTCRTNARARGVRGWVRNVPDGTVEAVFEGDKDAVTALTDWMRAGPPDAHVENCAVYDEEPEGLNGFLVR